MAKTRRYKVGCSGSGWGLWEIATGNKVRGFGRSRMQLLSIGMSWRVGRSPLNGIRIIND